jgi:hypothetical protein
MRGTYCTTAVVKDAVRKEDVLVLVQQLSWDQSLLVDVVAVRGQQVHSSSPAEASNEELITNECRRSRGADAIRGRG